MGSAGTEFEVADVISASRMNQKTLFVGTGTQLEALSTTYPGMYAYVTTAGGTKIADTLYQRNAANSAWVAWSVVGKQDIFIPCSAMWARQTSGAAGLTRVETATNKINYQVFEFDSATQEYIQFGWVPPRNYNNGTVKFTFWWTNASGLAAETVDWNVAGIAISNDDPLEVAMGSAITTTDTWIAQNDVHISPQSSAVTIGGTPADSDYIMFEISRKVSTDNLTGDARLIGVTMEYSVDAGISA